MPWPFKRKTVRVRMTSSAGEHAAGESYDLPAELADSFIIKGYAQGTLSREYDLEERDAIRSNVQRVGV